MTETTTAKVITYQVRIGGNVDGFLDEGEAHSWASHMARLGEAPKIFRLTSAVTTVSGEWEQIPAITPKEATEDVPEWAKDQFGIFDLKGNPVMTDETRNPPAGSVPLPTPTPPEDRDALEERIEAAIIGRTFHPAVAGVMTVVDELLNQLGIADREAGVARGAWSATVHDLYVSGEELKVVRAELAETQRALRTALDGQAPDGRPTYSALEEHVAELVQEHGLVSGQLATTREELAKAKTREARLGEVTGIVVDDLAAKLEPQLLEPLPEGVTIAHGMSRATPTVGAITLSCVTCGPIEDRVFYGWFDSGVVVGLWARKHDHDLPASLFPTLSKVEMPAQPGTVTDPKIVLSGECQHATHTPKFCPIVVPERWRPVSPETSTVAVPAGLLWGVREAIREDWASAADVAEVAYKFANDLDSLLGDLDPFCCPVDDPSCEGRDGECHDACEPPVSPETEGTTPTRGDLVTGEDRVNGGSITGTFEEFTGTERNAMVRLPDGSRRLIAAGSLRPAVFLSPEEAKPE